MFKTILKLIVKIISNIIYKIEVTGKENIPKNGKVLICSNHLHNFDSPILSCNIPREMFIIGKEQLFKNPIFGWFNTTMGVIPIKTNSAGITSLKKSIKVLNEGNALLVFPEGKRNGFKQGEDVKNGAAFLGIQSNSPIIPIKIEANYSKLRSKVKINIYEKIELDKIKYLSKNEQIKILTKSIRDKIYWEGK